MTRVLLGLLTAIMLLPASMAEASCCSATPRAVASTLEAACCCPPAHCAIEHDDCRSDPRAEQTAVAPDAARSTPLPSVAGVGGPSGALPAFELILARGTALPSASNDSPWTSQRPITFPLRV